MKKHIIFKGKRGNGKTLFSKIIFGNQKTLKIAGYKFNRVNDFLFDNFKSEWDYDFILVDNLQRNFDITSWYSILSLEKLCIDRRFEERCFVDLPTFIFIVDSELVDLPENIATFTRRFHVFDFDKDPISDLMKIIQDEKIIIKTAP